MQRCQCYNILFCLTWEILRSNMWVYLICPMYPEFAHLIYSMSFWNEPALSILSPRIDLGMGLPDLFIVLILIFHTVVMHSTFYYSIILIQSIPISSGNRKASEWQYWVSDRLTWCFHTMGILSLYYLWYYHVLGLKGVLITSDWYLMNASMSYCMVENNNKKTFTYEIMSQPVWFIYFVHF